MTTTPTLDYARPPRRWRWKRWVAALLVLAAVATAGAVYRRPIAAWAAPHYATWQYRRAYRAAERLVSTRTGIWSPGDWGSADAAMARLRVLSTAPLPPSPANVRVLFVRPAVSNGRDWLVFYVIDGSAIRDLAYCRDGLPYAAKHPLITFAAPAQGPLPTPVSATPDGDEAVGVTFDLAGSLNRLRIDFAARPLVRVAGTEAPLFPCSLEPQTGWAMQRTRWTPSSHGVERLEAAPAPRLLPAMPGGQAAAFLPDGRFAVAGGGAMTIVDPDTGDLDSRPIPSPAGWRGGQFSADGLWHCNLAGPGQIRIERTLGGPPVLVNPPRPLVGQWFDGRSRLVLYSESSAISVDLASGKTAAEDVPARLASYVRAGDVRAYAAGAEDDVLRYDVVLHRGESVSRLETFYGRPKLSLSPDGRWLAVSHGEQVRMYDTAADRWVVAWQAAYSMGSVPPAAWSLDGRTGASVDQVYVYVWTFDPPRLARFEHGMGYSNGQMAVSPDGKRLVLADPSAGTAHLWANPLTAAPAAEKRGENPEKRRPTPVN